MSQSINNLSPQEKRELLAKILKEKANKRNSEFPLSYGQKSLWFLYELAPESSAYNIIYAAKTRKNTDRENLRKSFELLKERHPSLQTKYITKEGKPLQKVCPELPLSFQVIDASNWNDSKIDEWINQEADKPFNLEKGDIFRVSLLTFSEANQLPILVLTIHHIAAEFWSLEIIIHELEIIYNALQKNKKPPLKALTATYKDYVQWEKQHLESHEGEKQWKYWQQKLSDELPIINLPTERPRPPVQTYNGETYYFEIDQELTNQLRELAKSEGATLYVTILAAFQVLLSRYSGQEDILLGSPLVNRSNSELENIIGYFVNPVVLRGNLSGNPNFKELLHRTRSVVLEALENSDFPFPLLVEKLQPVRDPSRSPLFQVSLAWDRPRQNDQLEKENINSEKLIIEPLRSEQRGSDFDTSLIILETEKTLKGSWGYNTDLFDEDTIKRMVSHFQVLLKGLVANPQEELSQLPLLTKEEEYQLLVEWNNTDAEYPQDKCIHQLFEEQVEKTPNAVAVVYEEEQLTYKELNQKANQLAHYLQKSGVNPDTLVGICVERSLEMVIGLLGILKAGGAYVPIDPNYPQERIWYMLKDSDVSLLLTQERISEMFPTSQAENIFLDKDWQSIEQENKDNILSQVNEENLAYVIYTSGSTGKPKGAMNAHKGVVNRLLWMQDTYKLNGDDKVLQKTPFGFDVSVWEFFWTLGTGASLIIAQPEGHKDSNYLRELIEKKKVTTLHFVPSMLQVFLEEKEISNCHSIKRVICSGEALPFDLKERFSKKLNSELHNLYGPTEAAIDVSFWNCRQEIQKSIVPIGRPVGNTQLYILDQQMKPVPIGVLGELHIGGVQVCKGYLNRPELTAKKFIPNPFTEGRLYKTGDLCRHLPDGNIEYIGRIDNQVKIRGFRIELGEIEVQLSNHPEIRESVVIAREDNPGNKQLVAYIVSEEISQESITQTLRDYLKEQLPDYMIPSAFVLLKELPLTPNGKIDRRALPSPDWSKRNHEEVIAPQTPIQEILASIWQSVLRVEPISIHDNFFELGGDSIISIQIVSKANQRGLDLKTKQIFQYQTIAKLANAVKFKEQFRQDEEQDIVSSSVDLTPIQHSFFSRNLLEENHYNQSILLEVSEKFNPDIFRKILQYLPNHHDALRLRFNKFNGEWQQVYTDTAQGIGFHVFDLSHQSSEGQFDTIKKESNRLQASLNFSENPIMECAWFNFGTGKTGRLLLIIHHLVVDGVSWRILLEDLSLVYEQISKGEPIKFPSKTASFKEFSQAVYNYAHSKTLEKEVSFWLNGNIKTENLTSIPVDFAGSHQDNIEASANTITVHLNEAYTKKLLRQVHVAYNTQIDDILLTALVQSFAEWTGERKLLIDLENHGRDDLLTDINLSRTVGWFTSLFPVFLELPISDSMEEEIKSIKEQLRQIPNKGIGYGILEYISPESSVREQLKALPKPEVVFNYLGQFDQSIALHPFLKFASESSGKMHSLKNQRSNLLEINGMITNGQLQLEWSYSNKFHEQSTIKDLARCYFKKLRDIIDHCLLSETKSYTPSDFKGAKVDQKQLDKLMNKLKRFQKEE